MSVYISGPMSGYPDYNRAAFHLAEMLLTDEIPGLAVVNPASLDLGPEASWTDYMRAHVGSVAAVDTLVTLPGWQESRGARLEVDLAHALGVTVMPLQVYLDAEATR